MNARHHENSFLTYIFLKFSHHSKVEIYLALIGKEESAISKVQDINGRSDRPVTVIST